MELLRLARADDWETVSAISQQLHNLHVLWRPDIFIHTDNAYPKEYFLEDIQKKVIYIAENCDECVGYVLFHIWETNSEGSAPSRVLDIDAVIVDEKYRGQGIGKRIMRDVKKLSAKLGCNDIQLSVYPQNEKALLFYESCGFKVRNIRYQMYL